MPNIGILASVLRGISWSHVSLMSWVLLPGITRLTASVLLAKKLPDSLSHTHTYQLEHLVRSPLYFSQSSIIGIYITHMYYLKYKIVIQGS